MIIILLQCEQKVVLKQSIHARLKIGRFLFWAGRNVFGLEWVGAETRPSVKQDRQIFFDGQEKKRYALFRGKSNKEKSRYVFYIDDKGFIHGNIGL